MKAHWIQHERTHPVNRDKDPLGLNNACIPDAPAWLNEYHDEIQTKILSRLIGEIYFQNKLLTVLDIGCGSGRWVMRLKNLKLQVTGIDIQKSIIEQNKKLISEVRWFSGDFRECKYDGELFDLITSVTVLQHIPTIEIPHAILTLRENLKKGGHLIALENISFRSETCHGYEISLWEYYFRLAGFKVRKTVPYDSGLFLRMTDHRWLRWMGKYVRHLDLRFDVPRYARHCGFLLEAI